MTNHPTPGPTSRPARIGFGLMWRVALTAVALALDGGLLTIPGLFLLGFALALYDVPRRLDRNAGANGVI